jgi:hypothetical protein
MGTAPPRASRPNRVRHAQDQVLARFLAAAEDPEDAWSGKTAMEPECLRAVWGACHQCGATGPRWRYGLEDDHLWWLSCDNDDCDETCIGAGLGEHRVACEEPDCPWADWPDCGQMPFLCRNCWNETTAAEAAHVAWLDEHVACCT